MNPSELPKVLAVLVAEEGNYMYVDKIGYVPSRDLAVFYLKEALRDFHSLMRKERFENVEARKMADRIDYDRVEREIEEIARVSDRKELREKSSLIAAKALAISARLGGGQNE
jgi:CRISPR-associated protein Csa5